MNAETAWFAAAGQPARMHPAPGGWRGRAGTALRTRWPPVLSRRRAGAAVRACLLPAGTLRA